MPSPERAGRLSSKKRVDILRFAWMPGDCFRSFSVEKDDIITAPHCPQGPRGPHTEWQSVHSLTTAGKGASARRWGSCATSVHPKTACRVVTLSVLSQMRCHKTSPTWRARFQGHPRRRCTVSPSSSRTTLGPATAAGHTTVASAAAAATRWTQGLRQTLPCTVAPAPTLRHPLGVLHSDATTLSGFELVVRLSRLRWAQQPWVASAQRALPLGHWRTFCAFFWANSELVKLSSTCRCSLPLTRVSSAGKCTGLSPRRPLTGTAHTRFRAYVAHAWWILLWKRTKNKGEGGRCEQKERKDSSCTCGYR